MKRFGLLCSISLFASGCIKEEVQDSVTGFRPEVSSDASSVIDSEIERLREKLDRYPDLIDLHLKIAYLHASREDYQPAAKEIKKAIRKAAGNPRFHFELGRINQKMGKWREAEESYRRVLELVQPNRYTGPHMYLGFSLAMQDKYEEALVHFHRALAIDPELAEAYYWVGSIHDLQGNQDGAVESWESYLKLGGPYSRQIFERLNRLLKLRASGESPAAPAATGT